MNEQQIILDIARYALFSGTLYALYFVFVVVEDEEFQDLAADIRWNTGLDFSVVLWVGFAVSFIGGWYLLPRLILKKLGIIQSNNNEDK